MNTRKIIITVLALMLTILAIVAAVRLPLFTWMIAGNSFTLEKEVFNDNIDAFEDTVKIVQKIIDENNDEDYICIGVNHYKGNISINLISPRKGDVKLSVAEQNSLRSVDKAFTSMDNEYSFDCIRVENGVILFDLVDGRYSVMYAPDADKKELYNVKEGTKVKALGNGWYHKKTGYVSFFSAVGALFGRY